MEDYAAFLDDDFEGAEDEEYAGLAQGDDNRGVSPQVLINTNELGTGHRTLLIATHPSASAFFRPKFLKKKPVGVILSSDVDLREESFVRTHKSSGAPIYVHDSSTVVVLCQSPVPDQESSSWVNALITEIKPERVIVFDTLNTPEAAVHHLPESAQMLQSASTKEVSCFDKIACGAVCIDIDVTEAFRDLP
ncbi:hypothetical protein BJ742DRAFT_132036 [Cladochytrium replicatum]|nr:hypothetical protein BJ742DRAFT_132036 [Cladochytrium replicatum]